MRARVLVGLIAAAMIVVVMPGIALAVRVSVSPTYIDIYRGSDGVGPVRFNVSIDQTHPIRSGFPTHKVIYKDSIIFKSFAAKCQSRRTLHVHGAIVVPRYRSRAGQRLRFASRLQSVVFSGVVSGRLKRPEVHGTIQVLRPGCDHAVMPFTAAIVPPPPGA